jgi:flagellar biogenesis protein FliO
MSPGQAVWFVVGTAAIIAIAYFVTVFLGTHSARLRATRNIKLRDRFALSKDKSFCLVEVKDKVYFIAVTSQSATLLDTLESEAFVEEQPYAPLKNIFTQTANSGIPQWIAAKLKAWRRAKKGEAFGAVYERARAAEDEAADGASASEKTEAGAESEKDEE